MNKRLVYSILSIFLLFLLVPSVFAEIFITQPSSRYNLGDNFDVKIEVKRVVETNDFLRVGLSCDSDSFELYKAPLRVQAGKSENITLKAKLDRSLIQSTEGSCKILAEYADESALSSSFEISDKIDLTVQVSSSTLNPSDLLLISGNARKLNGEKINGFLQISLTGTNVSFLASQTSDNFNYSFYIPENQAANLYTLLVKIYEREPSGEVANEGTYSQIVKVNQVIKSGDISISSAEVNPLENFSYTIILRDQTGKEVKTDVNSIIYTSKSKDNIFKRTNSKSGDIVSIDLPKNATPGNWEIEGLYGSIPLNKSFHVNTISKASFSVVNGNLIVTNEGNVPYENTINLDLGGTKGKDEELYVEESEVFAINGPDGSYNLVIIDRAGNQFDLGNITLSGKEKVFGLSFITGSAVSLSDPNSKSSSYFRIIFWVVLIIILSYLALYYYKKVRKDVFYGKKPQSFSSTMMASRTLPKKYISDSNESVEIKHSSESTRRQLAESENQEPVQKPKLMFNTYNDSSGNAKDSNDYQAKREEVVVLALKIKNGQRLRQSESSALNAVRNALHKAKSSRGKVYDQGDTTLVVFSQSLSEKASALEAVRVANEIDLAIKDFNKKFAIKVEYGLGMHIGEMFFELIDGKAKFTSIGNITILPKNLASKAEFGLLISEELYRKVYTLVKSEKVDGAYNILSFKDRSPHNQFIERFMNKPEDKPSHSTSRPFSHMRESSSHPAAHPKPHHSRFLDGQKAIQVPEVSKSQIRQPKPIADSGIHPPSKKRTFQRY